MKRDWLFDTIAVSLMLLIVLGLGLAFWLENAWWLLLSAVSLLVFCAG